MILPLRKLGSCSPHPLTPLPLTSHPLPLTLLPLLPLLPPSPFIHLPLHYWSLTVTFLAALRSKMKAAALKQCDPVVSAFADCARGRTLSVVWSCRPQAREINACLKQ